MCSDTAATRQGAGRTSCGRAGTPVRAGRAGRAGAKSWPAAAERPGRAGRAEPESWPAAAAPGSSQKDNPGH